MDDEIFLNERVDVVAVFSEGLHPCRPLKFRRANGREITITEIGLVYPRSRGKRFVHAFDVTDDGADYRLEFDAERLTWYLTLEGDHYES